MGKSEIRFGSESDASISVVFACNFRNETIYRCDKSLPKCSKYKTGDEKNFFGMYLSIIYDHISVSSMLCALHIVQDKDIAFLIDLVTNKLLNSDSWQILI